MPESPFTGDACPAAPWSPHWVSSHICQGLVEHPQSSFLATAEINNKRDNCCAAFFVVWGSCTNLHVTEKPHGAFLTGKCCMHLLRCRPLWHPMVSQIWSRFCSQIWPSQSMGRLLSALWLSVERFLMSSKCLRLYPPQRAPHQPTRGTGSQPGMQTTSLQGASPMPGKLNLQWAGKAGKHCLCSKRASCLQASALTKSTLCTLRRWDLMSWGNSCLEPEPDAQDPITTSRKVSFFHAWSYSCLHKTGFSSPTLSWGFQGAKVVSSCVSRWHHPQEPHLHWEARCYCSTWQQGAWGFYTASEEHWEHFWCKSDSTLHTSATITTGALCMSITALWRYVQEKLLRCSSFLLFFLGAVHPHAPEDHVSQDRACMGHFQPCFCFYPPFLSTPITHLIAQGHLILHCILFDQWH